jgi:methyl-accepting chemotaxis protein
MSLALFAALLLAQPSQSPKPEDVPVAESANGDETVEEQIEEAAEAVDEAAEEVDEAAERAGEAAEEAAEAAVEAGEEAVEEVCRRRHEYNEFGRRTSRKVCRPR